MAKRKKNKRLPVKFLQPNIKNLKIFDYNVDVFKIELNLLNQNFEKYILTVYLKLIIKITKTH